MDPLAPHVISESFSITDQPMDPGIPLPQEIILQIFSHLTPTDLKSTESVNRFWRLVTLEQKRSLSIDFVNFLDKKFDNKLYSTQKEKLLDIRSPEKLTLSKIHEIRENILNILKKENISELENLSKQTSKFQNLFTLAKIYKRIDQAENQDPPIDPVLKNTFRDRELKNSCLTLITLGHLSKAKEIALSLNAKNRDFILMSICLKFEKQNLLPEAKEIAETISHLETRGSYVRYYQLLIQNKGNIDNAIENARKKPGTDLKDIYWGLLWKGDNERTHEIYPSLNLGMIYKKRDCRCSLM